MICKQRKPMVMNDDSIAFSNKKNRNLHNSARAREHFCIQTSMDRFVNGSTVSQSLIIEYIDSDTKQIEKKKFSLTRAMARLLRHQMNFIHCLLFSD